MKHIILTIIASVLISANIFAQEQDVVTTGTLDNATPMYDMNFGEIVPYNDVFYKFEPTENTTISIELIYTGGVKDFSLSILSPNPTNILVPLEGEIGNDDESESEGEEMEEIPLQVADTITKTYDCIADTTYLIRVTDPNSLGGDFTIGLKDVTPFKVTTIADGSGTVSADSTYIRNSECTVSAVPADCYRFVNWKENGVEVSDDIEYTFLVDNNRNLTANFELREYEIYSSSENGTITETQNVICGNNQTFTFSPVDSCHEFAGLWVDGDSVAVQNNTSYTFSNIKEGYTIFASFKKKQHSLKSSNGILGLIQPQGTTDVFCGDSLTYTFVPQTLPNIESELDYIVVDGKTIYANSDSITNNSFTLYDVREAHEIFAAFKRKTFKVLAIADEHSTINGNTEVIKGENCNLTVDVDACYEIDSVFIDGDYKQDVTINVKNNGIYTFPNVTDSSHSIRISTKQKKNELKVFGGLNGAIKLNNNTIADGEDIAYLCGANSYLDFIPNATYEVSQVFIDNENITYLITDNKLDLSLITGNQLSVTFKKSPLKLYLIADGKGKIVFDGCDNNCNMLEVEYNSTPQICFLPESNNYKVGYILVDNDTITASHFTDNCYTLPQVTENRQITAYFVPSTTYFISAFASTNGQIDPSGYLVPVEKSESQQFCFYPEENYVVDYVMIDDEIVDAGNTNCYTIEDVMSDRSIYVSFSQKTGIENIEASFIKIYPNPVDNLLVIESSELKTGDKIDIFDISGKLALSLTINETDKVTVNVGGLSQGTYIFKLGHIQGKFVKK